MVKSLVKALH